MKKEKLYFAAFKGKSFISRAIRKLTRGEYSHIAFYDKEYNRLIEQWPHNGNMLQAWMDYSDFSKHSPETEYEVWSLKMSITDSQYCKNYYRTEAEKKTAYDFSGIAAFLFKGNDSKDKTFCSEASIIPIARILGWDRLKPEIVDPSYFINLIQAAGGQLEGSFVTQSKKED